MTTSVQQTNENRTPRCVGGRPRVGVFACLPMVSTSTWQRIDFNDKKSSYSKTCLWRKAKKSAEYSILHRFKITVIYRATLTIHITRKNSCYVGRFYTTLLLNKQAFCTYEGISKSFRTGSLERELQMVQLSATRYSCIAILWASLVSFAAIIFCVASQRVFIVVYFVIGSVRKRLDTP
jgi:hypothetical protein